MSGSSLWLFLPGGVLCVCLDNAVPQQRCCTHLHRVGSRANAPLPQAPLADVADLDRRRRELLARKDALQHQIAEQLVAQTRAREQYHSGLATLNKRLTVTSGYA